MNRRGLNTSQARFSRVKRMKQQTHEYVIALLILLTAVTGAAMMLTIPSLFHPQGADRAWITVALGCAFLTLAAAATHERRRHAAKSR